MSKHYHNRLHVNTVFSCSLDISCLYQRNMDIFFAWSNVHIHVPVKCTTSIEVSDSKTVRQWCRSLSLSWWHLFIFPSNCMWYFAHIDSEPVGTCWYDQTDCLVMINGSCAYFCGDRTHFSNDCDFCMIIIESSLSIGCVRGKPNPKCAFDQFWKNSQFISIYPKQNKIIVTRKSFNSSPQL